MGELKGKSAVQGKGCTAPLNPNRMVFDMFPTGAFSPRWAVAWWFP